MKIEISKIEDCNKEELSKYIEAATLYSSLYSKPAIATLDEQIYFVAYKNNGVIVVDNNYIAHLVQSKDNNVVNIITDGNVYVYNPNQRDLITRHPINNMKNHISVVLSKNKGYTTIEYCNTDLDKGNMYTVNYDVPAYDIAKFIDIIANITPSSIEVSDDSTQKSYKKKRDGLYIPSNMATEAIKFMQGYTYKEIMDLYKDSYTTGIDHKFIKKLIDSSDEKLITVAEEYKKSLHL